MEKSLAAAKREIRAAVEKGAALLDRRHPRWFEQIDLRAFDLRSGSYCICGQLDAINRGCEPNSGLGSWTYALNRLFGRDINIFKDNSRDETHGFSVSRENMEVFDYKADRSAWAYAEGIWKTEIAKRRRAKKQQALAA